MLCAGMLFVASTAIAMEPYTTENAPEERIIRCILLDYKTGAVAKFGLIIHPDGKIFCNIKSQVQTLGTLYEHSIAQSCTQARELYVREYPELAAFTIIKCEIISAQDDDAHTDHGYLHIPGQILLSPQASTVIRDK